MVVSALLHGGTCNILYDHFLMTCSYRLTTHVSSIDWVSYVQIHHGGSGSTHTSMKMGVPTIICPVLADQVHISYKSPSRSYFLLIGGLLIDNRNGDILIFAYNDSGCGEVGCNRSLWVGW